MKLISSLVSHRKSKNDTLQMLATESPPRASVPTRLNPADGESNILARGKKKKKEFEYIISFFDNLIKLASITKSEKSSS